MSGTELSSIYRPDYCRMEVKAHARFNKDAGGFCIASFTWDATDPAAVMMTSRLSDYATNVWTLGLDLLREIVLSTEAMVGEGRITGQVVANVARIMHTPPGGKGWIRVSVALADVCRFLSAVDTRLPDVKHADVDAELDAILSDGDCGGSSASWEEQ